MMTIETSPVDVFTVVGATPQTHSHRDQNQKHTSNYISYHFTGQLPILLSFSTFLPTLVQSCRSFLTHDRWLCVKFYHHNTPSPSPSNTNFRQIEVLCSCEKCPPFFKCTTTLLYIAPPPQINS